MGGEGVCEEHSRKIFEVSTTAVLSVHHDQQHHSRLNDVGEGGGNKIVFKMYVCLSSSPVVLHERTKLHAEN